jgi:hypothetical protein
LSRVWFYAIIVCKIKLYGGILLENNNSADNARFVIESDLSLKRKIDTVRIRMGRAYPGFLLVAACVIAYNYYLIMTGQNAQNDTRKTIILFGLMVVWAFIPVIIGNIKHLASKLTSQRVTIYDNLIVVETNLGTTKLTADDFNYVYEFGDCIKVDKTFKNVLLVDKRDVIVGDSEKLADTLRTMINNKE